MRLCLCLGVLARAFSEAVLLSRKARVPSCRWHHVATAQRILLCTPWACAGTPSHTWDHGLRKIRVCTATACVGAASIVSSHSHRGMYAGEQGRKGVSAWRAGKGRRVGAHEQARPIRLGVKGRPWHAMGLAHAARVRNLHISGAWHARPRFDI